MNKQKKSEFSDSLSKADEDLGDLEMNMNVDDILNEDDDFDMPLLKNNKNIDKTPKFSPNKENKHILKVQSTDLFKDSSSNAKLDEYQIKIKNESDIYVKNWNTEEVKNPLGDSKMELLLSKISLKDNNKSSNCEDLEKVLNEIGDNSMAMTTPNMNADPDFLKESESNKPFCSELAPSSIEQLDPLERLQKEEIEYSKSSENNENTIKYVLSEDISVFFPVQINNIVYEILEKITNIFFFQYSSTTNESSLNVSLNNTNLGLPRCISTNNKYLAIGTSNSLICVFDGKTQRLIKTLGSSKEQSYGSVTSLDISKEGDYIIGGYELGQIVLWDLTSNIPLKNVFGVHEFPIINIKFYKSDKSHAISCDSKGKVYILKINKVLFSYTVDKRLLFDKSVGPMLSIQVLYHDNKKNDNILPKDIVLVALATFNNLLIISIEPNVNIIYKSPRPEYIKEGSIPYLSWGKGILPGMNSSVTLLPVLSIAYGNFIELIPIDDLEIDGNLSIKAHFISDYEIIFGSWIAPNFIFFVDTRKTAYIIYIGSFEQGKYINKNKRNLNKDYNKAILNQQQIESELAFQTFIKDKNERLRPFFQNTIIGNLDSGRIYMICYRQIFIGKLYKWQEFITNLLEKNEWIKALKVSLELYKGNLKLFSDIFFEDRVNKDKMLPYMKDLIKKYVETLGLKLSNNLDRSKEKEIWETYIITSLDFLISIECFDYLFTEIKEIFKKLDLTKMFLSKLEPFILRNRVKFVPNESFREIANYFKLKKKIKLIELLIINLDIETLDAEFIISLCLDFHLYKALIYICNRLDNDFITPLVKMFMIYKEKLEKHEKDAKEFGYNCLWYIKISLQGIIFPNDQMTPDIYQIVVRNLIVWVFIEENIKVLIELDFDAFFPVIFLFFSQKSNKMLQECNDSLAHYFENHRLVKNNINYNKDPFFIHRSIIDIILSCFTQDNTQIKPSLYYFLVNSMVSCQLKLEFDFALEITVFLLKNHYLITNLQAKHNANNSCYQNYFKEDLGDLMLKLFKIYEVELRECRDIETLKEVTKSTPYLDILNFCYYLQKDYTKCFNNYLENEQKSLKKRIFIWLDEVLQRGDKIPNYLDIQELIMKRLKELVVIDSETTKNMLKTYMSSSINSALKELNPFPALQYELLEKLIADRKKGYFIENEYLTLYLNLMCKLGYKKELNKEIRNYDYPLDEALKLCKEYNMHESRAYLLDKAGFYSEALNLYLEILKALFQKAIKKLENEKYFDLELLQMNYDAILSICYKNKDNQDKGKLWFFLLDEFLKLQSSFETIIFQDIRFQKFQSFYINLLSSLLEEIVKNVPLIHFIKKINSSYGDINLKNLKNIFMTIFSNYSFQKNILVYSKQLILNELTDGEIKHLYQNMNGIGLKMFCSECKIQFSSEKLENIHIFKCKHIFHENCLPEKKCILCCKPDAFQISEIIYSTRRRLLALTEPTKPREITTNVELPNPRNSINSTINNRDSIENRRKENKKELILRKLQVFDYRKIDQYQDIDKTTSNFHFEDFT